MSALKVVAASEVRVGQTVTKIVCRQSPFGIRNQRIRRHRGHWPTAVEVSYRADGEGGLPTVYLTLSDDLTGTFCLDPDDKVTVEVTGS